MTQGHHSGCIIHLREIYRSCQCLLERADLGSLCWLTFGGKSTDWQKISSRLDYMPITRSLKEGEYKININIKATLKASEVGHSASWSSWLSCLQSWHKAYPSGGSDRWLSLPKGSKKPSGGSVSQ